MCRHRRTAAYCLGAGQTAIYYLSWWTVRFSFVCWRQPRGWAALDHGDNEWEFNHGSVNLSPSLCHTNQMSRDSNSPGHLYVCMFTVVKHRLSESKTGSFFRLMSGSGTYTADQDCKQETEKEAGPRLTLLCNTVIPQPCLIPVSITQLSESRPTLLTVLGQCHPPPLSRSLIQQLVSH